MENPPSSSFPITPSFSFGGFFFPFLLNPRCFNKRLAAGSAGEEGAGAVSMGK